MKAQDFLKLVGELLTVQQDYWARRRHADLVKAKELEKKAWAVVKQGRLEPDVVTTVEITDPAFVANNVPEQKPLFTEGEQ